MERMFLIEDRLFLVFINCFFSSNEWRLVWAWPLFIANSLRCPFAVRSVIVEVSNDQCGTVSIDDKDFSCHWDIRIWLMNLLVVTKVTLWLGCQLQDKNKWQPLFHFTTFNLRFKRIVQPKMKIMSWFTGPQVAPELFDCLFTCRTYF